MDFSLFTIEQLKTAHAMQVAEFERLANAGYLFSASAAHKQAEEIAFEIAKREAA